MACIHPPFHNAFRNAVQSRKLPQSEPGTAPVYGGEGCGALCSLGAGLLVPQVIVFSLLRGQRIELAQDFIGPIVRG
jgi:hypothetical protein